MQQLFRLKEGWETKRLREVCDIDKGVQLNKERSKYKQVRTYATIVNG